MLPTFNVHILGENERVSSLRDACMGKVGVIDLWHTKCQKCPAALDLFSAASNQFSPDEVMFVACALSLGASNKEDVADLALE